MKVIIKYIKFQHMFGRVIAMGQMQNAADESVVLQGSVAQMLQMAETEKLEIANAQEVLDILVRKGGFGA